MSEETNESITADLRELIELLGGRTKQVAEIVGVNSARSVRRWVTGSRSPSPIACIRIRLGLETARFVWRQGLDPSRWFQAPATELSGETPAGWIAKVQGGRAVTSDLYHLSQAAESSKEKHG